MILKCLVYRNRNHAGEIIIDGVGTCYVSARSYTDKQVKPGTYRLLKVVKTKNADEYGSHLLVFGSGSEKRIVCLHGGMTDDDDNLYPTAAGLRVSDEDLLEILDAIRGKSEVTLAIEEKSGIFSGLMHPYVGDSPRRLQRTRVMSQASCVRVDDSVCDFADFVDDVIYLLLSTPADPDYVLDPGFVFEGQGGTFGGGGGSGVYSAPSDVDAAMDQQQAIVDGVQYQESPQDDFESRVQYQQPLVLPSVSDPVSYGSATTEPSDDYVSAQDDANQTFLTQEAPFPVVEQEKVQTPPPEVYDDVPDPEPDNNDNDSNDGDDDTDNDSSDD